MSYHANLSNIDTCFNDSQRTIIPFPFKSSLLTQKAFSSLHEETKVIFSEAHQTTSIGKNTNVSTKIFLNSLSTD